MVGGQRTWFLWDGYVLAAEYNGPACATDGGPTTVGDAGKVGRELQPETVYAATVDHLDMPRMLTDSAGAVLWRSSHAALGRFVVDPGSSAMLDVRFPGQYADVKSGLHYHR